MNIINLSTDVRIVNYSSPFSLSEDILVERRVEGRWTRYWGTNSLSNDFAHSEAKRIATALRDRLLYQGLDPATSHPM